MDPSSKENATVLPPKSNHETDRRTNGTAQRMAPSYATNTTVDGIIESSVRMMDQTANGELDVAASKAANGHATNALSGIKLKASIIKQLDKQKPAVLSLLADVIGGDSGERFRAAIAPQHSQLQLAGDGKPDSQSDKPDQD